MCAAGYSRVGKLHRAALDLGMQREDVLVHERALGSRTETHGERFPEIKLENHSTGDRRRHSDSQR